jgi:hypothetical protein
MRSGSPGMYNALWHTLSVEMGELLQELIILQ